MFILSICFSTNHLYNNNNDHHQYDNNDHHYYHHYHNDKDNTDINNALHRGRSEIKIESAR